MINKRYAIRVDGKITASAETPISIELGKFRKMRQGVATNLLTKTGATEDNTQTDKYTGITTVTNGDLSVMLPNFDELAGLRTSTYQLLDAATVRLTETGLKDTHVELSMNEYMKMRGLKDRKEARNQARADARTLSKISISYHEPRRGSEGAFYELNLFQGIGMTRSGVIGFDFTPKFMQALEGYPFMYVHPLLWRLNNKRNPNSYYLLRKISELKHMNAGKGNEDIISVQTLLSCSPNFVSYEEVMAGNKNTTARIIEPFCRDMDALEDALTWEFCHTNGKPLTDKECENMSYSVFAGLLVHVIWREYPQGTGKALEDGKQKKGGKRVPRRKRKE